MLINQLIIRTLESADPLVSACGVDDVVQCIIMSFIMSSNVIYMEAARDKSNRVRFR